MPTKKFFYYTKNTANGMLLALLLCFNFFFAIPAGAQATLDIGKECESNDQCKSDDCETSTKVSNITGKPISYCDCGEINYDDDGEDDESPSCAAAYGGAATDWRCIDGTTATWDLDYCLRVQNTFPNIDDNVKTPIVPKDPSFWDYALDPELAISVTKIEGLINTPEPRIAIPGLSFTDKDKLTQVDAGGNVYLSIPFLGEYIAAIYKYAVGVAGIVSVIVIIISGIQWMTPGNLSITGEGDQKQTVNNAKKRIMGAVIGLLLSVGSYTLLYNINPELVSFRNLKVLYIKGQPVHGPGEDESAIKTITSIGQASEKGAPAIDAEAAKGICFPLSKSSFSKISWNFGGERAKGARCHSGIDIYTKPPGQLVAIDDGIVTNISKTFITCKNGWGAVEPKKDNGGAIYVYHPKLDITVNYGEIDSNNITSKKGDKITKGQVLGKASVCGMLHFEMYTGKQSGNAKWFPIPGETSSPPPHNKCAELFLSNKPPETINPTAFLKAIQSNFCVQ